MTALILRCAGRPVGDDLRPVGEPCGRVFKRPTRARYELDDGERVCVGVEDADDAAYVLAARAGHWSIGPNDEATCPACRKPSAGLVKDCKALAAGTRGGVE